MRPSDLSGDARDSFDMWRWFGLSESAAMNALVADGLVEEESSGDGVEASLRSIFGLTESAARVGAAARGRVSAGTFVPPRTESEWARKAQAALDEMSDAEVDQMYLEEQAKRRKAIKATPARSSGQVRSAVVHERRG